MSDDYDYGQHAHLSSLRKPDPQRREEAMRQFLAAEDAKQSMSSGAKAPAGWYPSPSRPGSQRYWDGAGWANDYRLSAGQPGAGKVEDGPSSESRPSRKTAWNTYYPWALALYCTISVIIVLAVVGSWMPTPDGVPRQAPMFPGFLGVLFFVMTGRQMFLRGRAKAE